MEILKDILTFLWKWYLVNGGRKRPTSTSRRRRQRSRSWNRRAWRAIPRAERALRPLVDAPWRAATSSVVSSARIARNAEVTRARSATRLRECVRADIYLPLEDNTKKPFSPELLNAFSVLLTALAGGHRSGGNLDGEWRTPNRQFDCEPVRLFTTTFAVEDVSRNVALIDEFVRRAFDQQAACIELTPILATEF